MLFWYEFNFPSAARLRRYEEPTSFLSGMPDTRTHRGPHPEDAKLFAAESVPTLAAAASDICWLLSRGYPRESALKLVGDRYALTKRQRTAVGRACCSDEARDFRLHKRAVPENGSTLYIDGYNVLTTIEAALGQGVIIKCRDSTFRDIAAMQGTYRKVKETERALSIMAEMAVELKVAEYTIFLDKPVSNSAGLKKRMLETAKAKEQNWHVELVKDPDRILMTLSGVIATSDSHVLDQCRQWCNFARLAVEKFVPQAWVIDLFKNNET